MSEPQTWVRNQRGLPPKPGLWHLVMPRAERPNAWSLKAVCGFHPDRYPQRADHEVPRQGALCTKCERAADTTEAGR